MIRAIIAALVIDAFVLGCFAAYTAGVVEGVTQVHSPADITIQARP